MNFALSARVLATVALSVMLPESDAVQRFGPNATTELLGIAATVSFVQLLMARDERSQSCAHRSDRCGSVERRSAITSTGGPSS